jgi:hypothetical protein
VQVDPCGGDVDRKGQHGAYGDQKDAYSDTHVSYLLVLAALLQVDARKAVPDSYSDTIT